MCNLSRSCFFLQYSVFSDARVWTFLQQWLRVPAIVSLTLVPAVLGVSPLISFPNYQPDPTSSAHKIWWEAPVWARMATRYYFCNSSVAATLQGKWWLFIFISDAGTQMLWGINERNSHCDTVRVVELCQRLRSGRSTSCNQHILQLCAASLQKSHTLLSVVHLGGKRGR